jgi:hypothetical protein
MSCLQSLSVRLLYGLNGLSAGSSAMQLEGPVTLKVVELNVGVAVVFPLTVSLGAAFPN